MHRMHHAYSDTEKDPHSPHFFRGIFSMLFGMIKTYESLRKRKIEPLPEFSHHLFEWERFDYYANSWPVRVLWGVLYTCFYFYFAPNLWFLLLLPVHYFMGPIHGSIVNWCGHKYGYRNFENTDKSRNTLLVDLLLMGELYQNNHHKFPNRLNFAFRWFEFDPAYPVVKFLSLVRIIRPRAAIGV